MTKFQFKQFEIEQSKSAMKVGTDGVLLGACAKIDHHPYAILDIGSGTGLISLMLAQRSNAPQIDAIEIDEEAFEECTNNFENSPWNDRVFCLHCSLDEFTEELIEEDETKQYDLIVTNPPFYPADYKSENPQRDLARFEDAMPFEDLMKSVDVLMSEEGFFAIIVPFNQENKIIELAEKNNLFPFELMRIKGNPEAEIKRSLVTFSRKKHLYHIEEMFIEYERHQYSEKYIELTKDFYLKM